MGFLKNICSKGSGSSSDQEERYRGIFDRVPYGIAVYRAIDDGADFVFTEFNVAGEQLEQVKKDDLVGHRVTKKFPGVTEFGLLEVLRRVWKTGKPELLPMKKYQDTRIQEWRENQVFKLPSGEVAAMYSEVEQHKKKEEEAMLFRALVDNINDGILIIDPDSSKIVDVNKHACEMLGYKVEELRTMNVVDMTVELNDMMKWQDVMGRLKQTGSLVLNLTIMTRTGHRIPTEATGRYIEIGGTGYAVSVVRDVTERKNASREMQDKLSEIERLNSFMIDREHRILEIKDEVNELLAELKRPPKYGAML